MVVCSNRPWCGWILTGILVAYVGILNAQGPKRELRGAWIATVENIDWPSSPGLSVEQQKEEYIKLLDELDAVNINAVVVQVRPAADAFYPSSLEPWSKYLSGIQGIGPNRTYDPLEFMIRETHARSMEFHAWVNPYRALNGTDLNTLADNHLLKQQPEWFVRYGDKYYFNPALPEVQSHVVEVIADLVRRYDIDAIHFDDYFYPYKIQGAEFPDLALFGPRAHEFPNLDSWRRNNVDILVYNIHQTIKKIKPYVQFGISPFGVWRNSANDPKRGSPSRAGQTCYDDLYADILLWMEKGWIDYVAPQLYWHIGFDLVDPAIMMPWWSEQVSQQNLYFGLGMYRVGSRQGWMNPSQLSDQINLARSVPGYQGSIFFSAKWFAKNPLGVVDSLKTTSYRHPALLPEANRTVLPIPNTPKIVNLKKKRKYTKFEWESPDDSEGPYYYVIYRFRGEKVGDLDDPRSIYEITGFNMHQMQFTDYKINRKRPYTYVITAVNREHVESVPSTPLTIITK